MALDNTSDPEKDELYEHYNFVASKGQEPLRVDKFLMNFIENATRNKIQLAAKEGHIWVNESIVKQNYKVKAGDEVKVFFEHPPYEFLLSPEDIPLNIVYEDESLLVVNKPAGMVVHPGHGNYSGTLINALLHHIKGLPVNSDERPGLVHRIDKDTSGLLVIAKTEMAMTHLAKQFFDKTSEREYVALVWGNIDADEGTIEGHIDRNPKNRLQMQVFPEGDKGKAAITHYKVLERVSCVWHIPGTSHGGVPEWSKGTDCKSVGQAFEGSNPSPSTTPFVYVVREISRAGIAQLVEHQPSKLRVASSSLVSRSILLVPWEFLRSPGLFRDF